MTEKIINLLKSELTNSSRRQAVVQRQAIIRAQVLPFFESGQVMTDKIAVTQMLTSWVEELSTSQSENKVARYLTLIELSIQVRLTRMRPASLKKQK